MTKVSTERLEQPGKISDERLAELQTALDEGRVFSVLMESDLAAMFAALRQEQAGVVKGLLDAADKLGWWLSAALEDPAVAKPMKEAINEWFAALSATQTTGALTSPPDAGGMEAHPDDLAVDRFAGAMKAKLAKKRAEGRGGWENKEECSAAFLSSLLHGHVIKGDPLDVGNLAMMLHQRGERILSTPNSAVRVGSEFVYSGRTATPSPFPKGEEPDYLVWSNEHRAWWRANSQGYARSVLEAGRYTRAEATDIADKSRNGWGLDRRPDEIAVAIADLPPPIRAALSSHRAGEPQP